MLPLRVPTLTPISSAVAFEGGSCQLLLNATNLMPVTQYGVGMWTTGAPVQLGDQTTDLSGSIIGGTVVYPSQTFPRVYRNAHLELYLLQGRSLGPGIVNTPLTIPVCLPTGLAP